MSILLFGGSILVALAIVLFIIRMVVASKQKTQKFAAYPWDKSSPTLASFFDQKQILVPKRE